MGEGRLNKTAASGADLYDASSLPGRRRVLGTNLACLSFPTGLWPRCLALHAHRQVPPDGVAVLLRAWPSSLVLYGTDRPAHARRIAQPRAGNVERANSPGLPISHLPT